MGCCLSTLEETKSKSPEKTPRFDFVSKSPPRPEEETVKEVLSETPKPKPKPETETNVPQNGEEPTKPNILVSPKKPFLDQKLSFLEQKVKVTPDVKTPEEGISEVSEMCSLSETISNTTLDEHHQNAVKDSASSSELRQRVFRSQGQNGHFHYNGNITNNSTRINHGRSPARRVDPSPPRRRYPGHGSGPGPGQGQAVAARRSRSPAARSNVGRSPSGRRAGPSPGRVRMVNGGPESVRKAEEENVSVSKNESEEGVSESLENPLVSLECFIFL